MSRTIIFGDVHGCYDELQDLLKEVNATKEDRLISVGDLVCKGPKTKETLDWAMRTPNLECVMGNHELHLLKYWKNEYQDRPMKDYQKRAFAELENNLDAYMKFIESWPYYIEDKDFIIVHGGLMPNIALADQNPEDLVRLRTVGDDNHPWHDDYTDDRVIVYGHWARQGLKVKENSIGLDSGCVYGKKLSAVILPEKKIVQVPARKVYVPVG